MEKVLEIDNLHVSFDTYAGEVQAVRGVSLQVKQGEVLAIVGESGCGKSVTAQTVMKLNPMPPARIKEGKITLCGHDIVAATEKEMRSIRGKLVSMIFQDPMTCLNPTIQVGKQMTAAIRNHQKLTQEQANAEAIRLLKLVQIPNAEQRVKQYPHEFSGGMRQRAMIAMALSCKPQLLIADEPTTALDVTIQAQIMDIILGIKRKLGTAIILITHDLGVVASVADRIAVMYAGKVMEEGDVENIFYHPCHPYTKALLKSIPHLAKDRDEKLASIAGTPPDLYAPPKGCEFAARCRYCMKICQTQVPERYPMVGEGHFASCWRYHPDYLAFTKEEH